MSASEVTLTLVTDRQRLAGRAFAAFLGEAARAGVDFVQVRETDLPDRALAALAREAVVACAGTGARVLVNGRADVARAVGAAGVQLPADGMPVADVRRAFPDLVIGASCHSVDTVRRAEQAGADFAFLGPIFATPGKESRALGLGTLSEAARSVLIPVHAIGGIRLDNAAAAVEAGARGLAAIRAFLEGTLPATIRRFRGGVPA